MSNKTRAEPMARHSREGGVVNSEAGHPVPSQQPTTKSLDPRLRGDDGKDLDATTTSTPRMAPHARHSRESGVVNSEAGHPVPPIILTPDKWITRHLGDPAVAQLVMGQSPPSSTYNSENVGLPFFQGKADFGYINPNPRVWCSAPARVGQPGDILMSVRAPVGDVNLATEECALGRGVGAIRPSQSVNGTFLFYALQFSKPQLVAASSGAIFDSINKTELHDFEIQLPPKPEQQKIAAILWKLQRAIATQDRLLKATRDLKQSAMQRLFTHGLRGEPLKDTEIGSLPVSWNVKALGDFGRIGNGSTPKKTRPEYWRDGTTPWLTSAKVHEGIIRRADQYVSDVAVKECHLPVVPCGSLLVAITGQGKTLGNAALVEFDTTINQHLAYVRFDRDDVHPAYVYQFMRSRYEELQGIGRAGGSTKAALTCALLRDYRVPCPPLDEQRDIATALATIDRKLAHHQRKRAALDDLFQTTLHQLMTAQVRVADLDIDTSEVTDHFPDAGKMVGGWAGSTNPDHFVDVNKMIAGGKGKARC